MKKMNELKPPATTEAGEDQTEWLYFDRRNGRQYDCQICKPTTKPCRHWAAIRAEAKPAPRCVHGWAHGYAKCPECEPAPDAGKWDVGQVVALRDADGSWIYARIDEFVDDGTVRLRNVDGRRKKKDIRPLNTRELGQQSAQPPTGRRINAEDVYQILALPTTQQMAERLNFIAFGDKP